MKHSKVDMICYVHIKDGNLDEVYVCNFQRDGSRPTVFDMQVLITNHFVLLKGKLIGSERQMEAFWKVGKVSDKEMNANESFMKHRYQ